MPRALFLLLISIVLSVLGTAPSEGRSRLPAESENARYASFSGHTSAANRIVSRDDSTGEIAYKRVVRLFRGHTDRVVHLKIAKSNAVQRGRSERHRVGEESGGSREGSDEPRLTGRLQGGQADDDAQEIRCTTEHPFWVQGRGWVGAKDLRPGDELVGSKGERLVVVAQEVRREEADHYNFEVEDFHTYFVSETEDDPAVWVHNRCFDVSRYTELGQEMIALELFADAGQKLLFDVVTKRGAG